MVLKNDGQPPEKPWATVSKMMGNVFYFYEQRFPKPWATDGNNLAMIKCEITPLLRQTPSHNRLWHPSQRSVHPSGAGQAVCRHS